MKSIILLLVFSLPVPWQVQVLQQAQTLSEQKVVQDTVVANKVLKSVKTHVLSITRDRKRPLVVRDNRKSRKFIVRKFLGEVTREKNIYTAQLDTDEFDHLIPRILYVDVRASRGTYKVIRVRIGPKHFREKEIQR